METAQNNNDESQQAEWQIRLNQKVGGADNTPLAPPDGKDGENAEEIEEGSENEPDTENDRKKNLQAAHFQAKNFDERGIIGAGKKLAEKLNKEIDQGHETGAFLIALLLATVKDVLDLVFLPTIIPPATGVEVVWKFVGLFLSATLFYFLWGKGWFLKSKIKIIWWILGLLIDSLPLLDIMPMNIFMVLMAWHTVHQSGKEAEAKKKELNQTTKKLLGYKGKKKEVIFS